MSRRQRDERRSERKRLSWGTENEADYERERERERGRGSREQTADKGTVMMASASLPTHTFDLKGEAVAMALVSILHPDGVVPTVLLLGPDQGQDTLVSAGRTEVYGIGLTYISYILYSLIKMTTNVCLLNTYHLCYKHITVLHMSRWHFPLSTSHT